MNHQDALAFTLKGTLYSALSTNLPDFPKSLWDVAVVGAFKLGEDERWRTSVLVGAGTANDAHFSNSDALYGIADFNAERKLTPDTSLHFGVHFDGNRNIWPDLPLPYLQYVARVDDTLGYALGVPRSAVTWRPLTPLVLHAEYNVPVNVNANASFYLNENLSLFGEYLDTTDGFYIDDAEKQRLFYSWQRVAAGVRISNDWLDARLGAGWAFNQEFSTGWDLRDTDTVVEPDDGPMFFITIQGTF